MLELLLATVLQGSVQGGRSLGVIGIRLDITGKKIVKVHDNTPASDAGLLVGDKVIASIDKDGRKDIDGAPGTDVVLLIKREGKPPLVKIVRRQAHQTINNKDVRGFFRGREDYEI